MKQWKTVLVTVVIVLLVVALGLMVLRNSESQVVRDTKGRIKQYEIIAKEQRLITEILQLKYDAALIQSKFKSIQPAQQQTQNAPPGTITGMEYIPIDKIPSDAKVSEGLGAPPK